MNNRHSFEDSGPNAQWTDGFFASLILGGPVSSTKATFSLFFEGRVLGWRDLSVTFRFLQLKAKLAQLQIAISPESEIDFSAGTQYNTKSQVRSESGLIESIFKTAKIQVR
jgi:hypothetical protein